MVTIIGLTIGVFYLIAGVIGYKKASLPYWHPTFHCGDCNKTDCRDCEYLEIAKREGTLFPYSSGLKRAR